MSNNSFVAQALDSHMPSFQQRLYNLFANYNNYSSFSNEAWIPSDNNGSYDSVESLHDSIHTLGGGNFGHLSIIQYSAFDPLFMLHHVNVDRIFAMWQVLYNDSYVKPMQAVYPSHTTSSSPFSSSRDTSSDGLLEASCAVQIFTAPSWDPVANMNESEVGFHPRHVKSPLKLREVVLMW